MMHNPGALASREGEGVSGARFDTGAVVITGLDPVIHAFFS